MVFHGSLSDSKSPQVSRTLLSILAVLSNAIMWIVYTRPPTSKSSSPFNNPLVTVPKAPITIGIIVIFMFHSMFSSLARSAGTAKSTILQFLFFCWLLLGLVFWPRLGNPCICQSPIGVYVLFSRTAGHISFVGMVKFKFLAHLPVDHLAHPAVSSFILLLC